MSHATSPREIAAWRYHQIAPFLDETLSAAQKRRLRSELCRVATTWPNGRYKKISRPTLLRKVEAFNKVLGRWFVEELAHGQDHHAGGPAWPNRVAVLHGPFP